MQRLPQPSWHGNSRRRPSSSIYRLARYTNVQCLSPFPCSCSGVVGWLTGAFSCTQPWLGSIVKLLIGFEQFGAPWPQVYASPLATYPRTIRTYRVSLQQTSSGSSQRDVCCSAWLAGLGRTAVRWPHRLVALGPAETARDYQIGSTNVKQRVPHGGHKGTYFAFVLGREVRVRPDPATST